MKIREKRRRKEKRMLTLNAIKLSQRDVINIHNPNVCVCACASHCAGLNSNLYCISMKADIHRNKHGVRNKCWFDQTCNEENGGRVPRIALAWEDWEGAGVLRPVFSREIK